MQYRKPGFFGIIVFLIAIVLTGCKDKGGGFIGHWVEKTNNNNPSTIDIAYNDGVFHIDYNKYYSVGLADFKLKKLEAKAESEDVLNIISGMGKTMRLNNGVIDFDNSEFIKSK